MLAYFMAMATLPSFTTTTIIDEPTSYQVQHVATLKESNFTSDGIYPTDLINTYSTGFQVQRGRFTFSNVNRYNQFGFTLTTLIDDEPIYSTYVKLDDVITSSTFEFRPIWYVPYSSGGVSDYYGKELTLSLSFNCDFNHSLSFDSKSPTLNTYVQYYYDDSDFYNAYNQGYDNAVSDLQQDITNAYNQGYNQGYNIGVNTDSNLMDLVSAVPDTFVNSFETIFDFEIFGVNIANFIITIVSLGIVIFIIKKVV